MTRIQAMVFTLLLCEAVNAAEPIDIGSRRELFVHRRLKLPIEPDHDGAGPGCRNRRRLIR